MRPLQDGLQDARTGGAILRVFLSYHTPDRGTALAIKEALRHRDPSIDMFVDQSGLRAGAFWLPKLGDAIRESDAFVMLVGNRLGDWQKIEYYEALDRKSKQEQFPIIPIISVERPPNLPFLSQLHWITASEPDAPEPLGHLTKALRGGALPAAPEPWRTVNPYRGLLALDEEDADFFYGRETETIDIVNALITSPSKLIALIGNSGVGKSSLVQAGVIGCLKRQRWPTAGGATPWPVALKDSRAWCYLTIKPGADPIGALASEFVALWFERVTDPDLVAQRNRWAQLLLTGEASLRDLVDATEKHFRHALNVEPPHRIVLYIDQGEELYACDPFVVQRFSQLLAAGLKDERLIAITSQRSDTYGRLQANDDLFPVTVRIDVAPVGADALRSVLIEPPRTFHARYENEALVDDVLAQAKGQRGALPLVADFMEDLWLQMQERGDGVIRALRDNRVFYLGGTLVERCELFLQKHAAHEEAIKRLFTQKLVRVYELGEPIAYHVTKAETTDEEWQLLEALAAPNWRLVVIGEQGGQPRAEVMHDILIRQWPRLQEWLSQERELAVWKTRVESAHHLWQGASRAEKPSLLLNDYALRSIITSDAKCRFDVSRSLAEFIHESARVRGSWWHTSLALLREIYSGVTFKKVLLGLLMIVGGTFALYLAAVVAVAVLKARGFDLDIWGPVIVLVFATGSLALIIRTIWYLFRDKKRQMLTQLSRNLALQFSFVPRGVGGFLLVVAAIIAVLVGAGVADSASAMRIAEVLNRWSTLTDSSASGRLFSAFGLLDYGTNVLTELVGLIAVIAIFKRKPAAQSLTLWFFGLAIPTSIADYFLNTEGSDLWEPIGGVAISSVLLAACAMYFQRSRRYQAAFGRPLPA
jgi:hypothetical protein